MYAYISNSAYVSQFMFSEPFGTGNPYVNITNYVEPGINVITLKLYNDTTDTGAPSGCCGYAYTWDFAVNGVLSASASCGNWNIYGCNYDSYAKGLVYVADLVFSTSGTSVTTDTIYNAHMYQEGKDHLDHLRPPPLRCRQRG